MVFVAVAVTSGDAGSATDATFVEFKAGAVFVGSIGVEVAGGIICTARDLIRVADSVAVEVSGAVSSAFTEGVELISVAVAIASRNSGASAIVDGTGPGADSAVIVGAYAIIHVVANTVGIQVSSAVSSADAEGIELIAVTIAGVLSGAIATALSAFVQRQATAVVCRGLGIKIARGDVGTTEFWNGQVEVDGVLVVAAEEDLNMEVAAQFSIRGELGNLNALFWTGDAIRVIAQNEPHASDEVIELKAGPIPIILWLEHR